MKVLNIDIETRSDIDLNTCGVYKYVESPSFTILLFCYSVDDGPEICIDIAAGQSLPREIYAALQDLTVIKKAFNASFERVCINKFFNIESPRESWRCTMVKASMLGFSGGLGAVAQQLGLQQQKMAAGAMLIRKFCIPKKSTDGIISYSTPHDYPQDWETFKEYCIQDVRTEKAIDKKLSSFEISALEWKLYALDQLINDRGIHIDIQLVKKIIEHDRYFNEKLTAEAIELTGLKNPRSVQQLLNWLNAELFETDEDVLITLTKKEVPKLISRIDDEKIKRVLELRQLLSVTSIRKYNKLAQITCNTGRCYGIHQFYGARTGRFAGRLVQPQNLPRISISYYDTARQLMLNHTSAYIAQLQEEGIIGSVPSILSQLIRTAFVAKEGHRLLVADFSAIEARVLAWLAGEEWKLEEFRGKGKIYELVASRMFGVPIERITKDSDYRQRGKVTDLSMGYQGGVGALIRMGALDMGIQESELEGLKTGWRSIHPMIVQLWHDLNEAAINCIRTGATIKVGKHITFSFSRGIMFIELPNGRKLAYPRAKLYKDDKGRDAACYEGRNQTTKKWDIIRLYGGIITENIVQAISRDLLCEAMLRLEAAAYEIVMHVHDEVVCDMPEGKGSLKEMLDIMRVVPAWATGLPLNAAGFENKYYKKD